MDEQERLRLDYDESVTLLRGLTDTRFRLLALVPTIAGAAVGFLTGARAAIELLALGLVGFAATLGILIYELRAGEIMASLTRRVRALETRLLVYGPLVRPSGRKLFGTIPVSHRRGVAIVFGTALGAWAYVVGWGALRTLSIARARDIGLVIGVAVALVMFMEIERIEAEPAEELPAPEPPNTEPSGPSAGFGQPGQDRPSRQEPDAARVDVHALVVLGRELDGAVDLQHDEAVVDREEIDPDEVAPHGPRRRQRELARLARRLHRLPPRAERDVRAPFPRLRDTADRADDPARGDDDPQVMARRRHEGLDERTGRPVPGLAADRVERVRERGERRAEDDVAAPAAKARLQYDRELDLGHRAALPEVLRPRVGQRLLCEHAGGDQLVVGGAERERAVEDEHPAALELVERPDTGLDPVDGREDVEPRERDVSATELGHRLRRREHGRVDPVEALSGELGARARLPSRCLVRDNGKAHLRAECSVRRAPPQGRSPACHRIEAMRPPKGHRRPFG